MKNIGGTYKPKRYARRDRHGKGVDLNLRAEAIKDYLEKEQWGEKD